MAADLSTPMRTAPHSEWRLGRAAEGLLGSHDAADHALTILTARHEQHTALKHRPPGDGRGAGPGPLFWGVGAILVFVMSALSAAGTSGLLHGPSWAGTLISYGAGTLAAVSVLAAARITQRRHPDGGVRSIRRAAFRLSAGSTTPGSYRVGRARGRRRGRVSSVSPGPPSTKLRPYLIPAGAAACAVAWLLPATGLMTTPWPAVAGVALAAALAAAVLPLIIGGPPRRVVGVRAAGRFARRRSVRRMRRAHARARRLLLNHERAWQQVLRAAELGVESVPEPDRATLRNALLTTCGAGPEPSQAESNGAKAALGAAVRLLRATDPAPLRRRLSMEQHAIEVAEG